MNKNKLFRDKGSVITNIKKMPKRGLFLSMIISASIISLTWLVSNNANALALLLPVSPQKITTVASVTQQSNSAFSSDGNQTSIQSNTNDGTTSSSSISSSSSGSNANNLSNDINSLVGNIGKDVNKIIQNSVQKSTSGVVSASTDINKMLAGKIASSQLNLVNGKVERVVFGDWSLDAKSGQNTKYSAKFAIRASSESSAPSSSTAASKLMAIGNYALSNLNVNSVQRTNEDMILRGTVDVSRQSSTTPNQTTQSWIGIPVTISITNGNSVMSISFDKDSPVSQVFQNIPILGLVTKSS